jgi:hypothetical protein
MNSYTVTETVDQSHVLYPQYVWFRNILFHMCACEKQFQQGANELARQKTQLDTWLLIIDQQRHTLDLQEKLLECAEELLPIEMIQQLGRIAYAPLESSTIRTEPLS